MMRTSTPSEVIPATMAESKPGVIEAQQMQHGGVDVMHMNRILDGLQSQVVGGAVHSASSDSTSGEQSCKPMDIMVASLAQLFQAAYLNHRRAAEFAADHYQGLIE